jgi:hypothetical protein
MPEYTEIDHSITDDENAEERVEYTTPQGTQFYGVINGHEHRDISVRSVTIWMWGLFCFVIVLAMSLAWLFFGILHSEEKGDTIPSANFASTIQLAPLSQEGRLIQGEQADRHLPTITQTPPLMPDPHQPMVALRHQEDTEINSYGYVNDAQGKKVGVHIPVDEAMTLALQKGFPVVASPTKLRPLAPVSPALEPAEDKGF